MVAVTEGAPWTYRHVALRSRLVQGRSVDGEAYHTPSTVVLGKLRTTNRGDQSALKFSLQTADSSIPGLIMLDQADNKRTGSIPTELSSLFVTLYLELGRNLLSGTIPSELAARPI